MRNQYNIHFNNSNAKDIGIIAIKRPSIPVPEKNLLEKEVKGRNGSVMIDYKTYKNITKDIEFNFLESKDFLERCRTIKKWFYNIQDNRLIESDDTDYFYKVKRVVLGDIERELKIKGTFTASFILDPFQYSKYGLDEIILTNNFILENPYFIEAAPIINMWGEGSITLNINGNKLTVNLGQSIIINSDLGLSYRIVNGNTQYQNTRLKGDYPVLIEGENKISYTLGTGARLDKISIIPNFRTL